MKKRYKVIFFLSLFIGMMFVLSRTNNVKAATTSGHYTYEENKDGTIKITDYDRAAAENLVIPSKIDGKTVTKIGISAFDYNHNLTGTLTIPNTVIYIEDYAFFSCTGIEKLVIPNSVKDIGSVAFACLRAAVVKTIV